MMTVKLSRFAEQTLDDYFSNYVKIGCQTDMLQRAYNYSRILYSLAHITNLWDKIYIEEDANFIDIDSICKIQFATEKNNILIENIIFQNS